MMAKMFYTIEETKSALGKSDDEIKQLTRDGRLREFRDGARLMFKADQVENLRGELGSSDAIDLGPSDTGGPIGLADSRSGSGALSLADSVGLSPSPSSMKDDTALAADLGLSGSIGLSGSVGGVPSPARPGTGTGSGLSGLGSGGSQGSRGGINVLGDDASVDPMAQTAINPAMNESFAGENMGSGSGLLDLTRESDNTSLGAVLDEIPGGTRSGDTMGATSAGMPSGLGAVASSPTRVVQPPMYVLVRDPMAPAIGGMALFATLFAVLGVIALTGGVVGNRPGLVSSLQNQSLLILAAIGLGITLIGFVGGLILGKVRS
jgi:hypothetical protein